MAKTLPVWKTIRLGTGRKSAAGFPRAIRKSKMAIANRAKNIFEDRNFDVAGRKMEVELVKVTVAELGFKKGARIEQVYSRAKELGLELCPAEVGPQLRLQYRDQPEGEWMIIAMEPMRESDGFKSIFFLGRNGSRIWLNTTFGEHDSWEGFVQVVFVRPRKK